MSNYENHEALDDLLAQFDEPVEGFSKTAEFEGERGEAQAELEGALTQVIDNGYQVVSPEGDIEKIAEDVWEQDLESLDYEADRYGKRMAEAFVEKLAAYDGLLQAIEGEPDVDDMSAQLGYEDGSRLSKWAMETLFDGEYDDDYEKTAAEVEFDEGYNDGIEKAAFDVEFDDGYNDGIEKAAFDVEFDDGYNEGAEAAAEELGIEFDDYEKTAAEVEFDEGYNDGIEKAAFDVEFDEGYNNGAEAAAEELGIEFEGEGEEKTAEEVEAEESFAAGYDNGVEFIEKKAEELGTYDFLWDLEV